MKIKNKLRYGFIHLYNPKKEGLGSYDINYINAYKRCHMKKDKIEKLVQERDAA